MKKQISIDEYNYRINLVLEYIHSHLDENLSLQKLAGISFFSPYHFHRIFQGIVGEAPGSYIRRLKLERAWKMFVYGKGNSVVDVAKRHGYTSTKIFHRAFKAAYKTSPKKIGSRGFKEYEKNIRINGEPISSLPQTEDLAIEVKSLPSFHVAFVRHFGGYNKKIALAFEKLKKWALSKKIDFETNYIIGVGLDSPLITIDDKCRFLACITVDSNTGPEREIGITDLYGGLYAVCPFIGKMKHVPSFYFYLFAEWLPGSGYEPVYQPFLQFYKKQPSPEDRGVFYLDLCIPIKPLQYKSPRHS